MKALPDPQTATTPRISPKPDIRPEQADAKQSDAGLLRLIVRAFDRASWSGSVYGRPASYHTVVDDHGDEWRVWSTVTMPTVAALEWSLSTGKPVAVTIGRSSVPDEGDDILSAKMVND